MFPIKEDYVYCDEWCRPLIMFGLFVAVTFLYLFLLLISLNNSDFC